MSRPDDPTDTTRYTRYSANVQGIIRTVDAYVTDLPNQPEDVVEIQVLGPDATGFIVLRPTGLFTDPANMEVVLTYGYETHDGIQCLNTLSPSPIATVLATMDEYISQYWDQFTGFRVDIAARYTHELRTPIEQEHTTSPTPTE